MNDLKKKYKLDIKNVIKEEMINIRTDNTLTNREKMLELKTLDKVIDKIEDER